MFTSVTKKSLKKSAISFLALAIFCVIFTFVYERFSFGESSPYMRFMFLAPLAGSLVYLLAYTGVTWLRTRASALLFNSSLAIILSGCLIKGIIEVSGRTTNYEQPYWTAAAIFLLFSLMSGLLFRKPRLEA